MLAQTLTDACGADPGVVCEFIFDVTGSETAAGLSELLAKPIRVVLILLVAWLVNRVVRRSINGAVDSWLERRDDAVRQQAAEAEQDSLRAAAIRKARKLAQQPERGSQRAQTLGAVLRSIAAIIIYSIAAMMAA